MPGFILSLWHQIVLSLPLFVLIALGYGLIRWGKWPASITDGLTRFVFSLALPAMLFRMMCDFSQRPAVDARLLIAFFGSCLIVFVLGRLVARHLFRLDGVAGSVFALGGIFSNNVMLGLPIAGVMLGEAAIPSVALVLVFYFAHYLFASLSAHTATMLPVILAVGKGLPGVPMEQLSMLLVLSIGIMGVLTPYATGPGVIIYGCGYVKSKDYWRLGGILGVVYIAALLLIGWPIMSLWY